MAYFQPSLIALALSFLFTGLGTIYAGNTKKGVILIGLRIFSAVLVIINPIFMIATVVVWIFGFYDAYAETRIANGVANPNLIQDIKGFNRNNKIIAILVICLILMIAIFGIISAFTPTYHPSSDSTGHHVSTSTSSSGSSGHSHYGGVDDSPNTIAKRDPDWYHDHYDYGDNDKIDEYLESQGYD